jgi:hypothetical protein
MLTPVPKKAPWPAVGPVIRELIPRLLEELGGRATAKEITRLLYLDLYPRLTWKGTRYALAVASIDSETPIRMLIDVDRIASGQDDGVIVELV